MLGGLHHVFGATDESQINFGWFDETVEDFVAFGSVQATVEEGDLLFLARKKMKDRQPTHETVLERRKLFLEQDVGAHAVTVEDCKPAFGFDQQRGLDQGQHRGNPRACGERNIGPGLGRIEGRREMSGCLEHVQQVAGLQRFVGKGGKATTTDPFDSDAQLAVQWRGADGIVAANVFASDLVA